MKKDAFDKRIFTPALFFGDAGFLLVNLPGIVGAMRNKEIGKAFMEKIMSVTSAVNGCSYCSWFHAQQALASGMSAEEVRNMMNLQFHADASEKEIMALLYAQHYAETDRMPDADMTSKFQQQYGPRTARHLYLIIRLINFGNLYGNTWDAVLSRSKGKPAPKSNLVFELFFFLLSFWFMFPLMAVSKG